MSSIASEISESAKTALRVMCVDVEAAGAGDAVGALVDATAASTWTASVGGGTRWHPRVNAPHATEPTKAQTFVIERAGIGRARGHPSRRRIGRPRRLVSRLLYMTNMRLSKLGFSLATIAFGLASPRAFAQSEPSAPVSPDASPSTAVRTTSDTDGGWDYRYKAARDRLVNGDFASASQQFRDLAASTHDGSRQRLAIAQAELAEEWQHRGLVLIRQSMLGEAQLSAKSVGERTSDEISVLYTSSVLYGIGTGAWVGSLANASSSAGIILPMLGFAGAAAGTVALLDVGHPLHYGVAQSIVSGMYIGLEEGSAIALYNAFDSNSSNHWSGNTVGGIIWGTATAGAVAGGVIGSLGGTTPGRASFVGSSALWTGLVGGLAAEAFVGPNSNGHAQMLTTLVGLNVGAIGGVLAAGPVSPSIARVRFLDLGGIAGGLVGGGLYLAAGSNSLSEQAFAGATAIGIGAGLGIAWAATSGMAPDRLDDHESKVAGIRFSPTLIPAKGMMIGLQGGM